MTEQSNTSSCPGCSEHGAEHGRNGLTGELQLQVRVWVLLVWQQACLRWASPELRASGAVSNR